jgi:hypothetical protein
MMNMTAIIMITKKAALMIMVPMDTSMTKRLMVIIMIMITIMIINMTTNMTTNMIIIMIIPKSINTQTHLLKN